MTTTALAWTRAGAEFSTDRRYRYHLWRRWNDGAVGRVVTFIMLNPSKADDRTDDATIRRCIGFAKRWGFDGLDVVNLLAVVETHPERLPDLATATGDPRCLEAVCDVALAAAAVVAAWGEVGARWPNRERDVYAALRRCNVPLQAFAGATSSGRPFHPLRLRADHPLQPWTTRRAR